MLVGVVVLVKNEESIIGEWLAFYKAHGFDRIHVFDNDSTDRTAAIVRQAARCSGGITIESWPTEVDYWTLQHSAYQRGLEMMRNEGVEWCLFVDADEFLVCTEHSSVRDLLESRNAHAALAINWSFYGSSGFLSEPPGLMIENFIWRAPANFDAQCLYKSFVRLPYVQGCINGHSFKLDETHFPYVTSVGGHVDWESRGQDHPISPWRINHYFVRSREWWAKKVARSQNAGFERYEHDWNHYDRNEEFDPCATKYGSGVRHALAVLGLPVPADPEYPFSRHFMEYCIKRGVFAGQPQT